MSLNVQEMIDRSDEIISSGPADDRVIVQVRLPPEVLKLLDHARIEAGQNRSKFLACFIEKHLGEISS